MKECSALANLIHIAKGAMAFSEFMLNAGFVDNPYYEIYWDAVDAIYFMLGEQPKSFEDSITYKTMTDKNLTETECLIKLLSVYKSNNPDLSDATMSVVSDAAEAQNITVPKMINLIVSEWAMRQQIMRTAKAI